MLKVTVISPKRTIFEGEARSVSLPGQEGEFEVLEFHKAIISLLKQGEIVIDGLKALVITKGIVRVHKDELVALVEE